MASQRPILFGLVGDSASGKSTLAAGITDILGRDRVTVMCADDYHRYDRTERAKLGITPLDPNCNYLDVLELHLDRLRSGLPILKPVYDHSDGTLARPEYVRPREFVIVEGLLAFHTQHMRDCFDVKVYLDPPEDLRRVWKIKRDTTKRGYTAEQVLAELDRREKDSARFIRPQRSDADIVVRFHPPGGTPPERANGRLNVRLVLRPTIPHPDFSNVFEYASIGKRPAVRLELRRDGGRPADFLEIDGNVLPEEARELEEMIWSHLPEARHLGADEIGVYADRAEVRHSDPLALTQLLISYHMLRAAQTAGSAWR
jgi:phosphoribulokinase